MNNSSEEEILTQESIDTTTADEKKRKIDLIFSNCYKSSLGIVPHMVDLDLKYLLSSVSILKDDEEMLDYLKLAVSLGDKVALLRLGLYFEDIDVEKSKQYYKKALEYHIMEAAYLLSKVYRKEDNKELELHYLLQAPKKYSSYRLGEIHEAEGNLKEAILNFKAVSYNNMFGSDSHYRKGMKEKMMRRYEAAFASFNRAFASKHTYSIFELGLYYENLLQNFEKAISYYESVFESVGSGKTKDADGRLEDFHNRSHFYLAMLYKTTLNDTEKMRKHFTEILESKCTLYFSHAAYQLGLYYLESDNLEEAYSYFNQGICFDNSSKCHLGMGRVFFIQGKKEEALSHLLDATSQGPAETFYHLALYYEREENDLDMIACLEQGVVKNDPKCMEKLSDFYEIQLDIQMSAMYRRMYEENTKYKSCEYKHDTTQLLLL